MNSNGGVTFGLIVEGQGEVQAAPLLIRKIALEFDFVDTIKFEVRRIGKSQLVQSGELARAIDALTRQIGRDKPVLVLLDADNDCVKDLAGMLINQSRARHPDVRLSVVIATMEYEAWFLAAAESLAGHKDLPDDLASPPDPESVRGAKERLSTRMLPGRSYSPTRHQPAFSQLMDLKLARRSGSFRKLERELCSLLGVRN